MTKQPFIVEPKDYGPALSVLGAQITVLAPNARTFGYEITLQAGQEGVGPEPGTAPPGPRLGILGDPAEEGGRISEGGAR